MTFRADVCRGLAGKLALVTGAGSGIGRATALALAKEGARLVAVDVSAKRVDAIRAELGAACAMAEQVDVAKREEMRALAGRVHGSLGALDVLVNNAGVGHGGGVIDTKIEDWDWVLGVNLLGVVHGCHFFVPEMVGAGRGGHVVNVASAAGLVAPPGMAPYATTKFAVVGLSESMRAELAPHRIGVSAICPGIIATDIVASGRFADESIRPRVVEELARRGRDPSQVARAILDAIRRDVPVVPVGAEAWALWVGKRVSPALTTWVGRKVEQKLRGGRG